MRKQFKGFIAGVIFACLLVLPTTALADNVQAQFNTVNITVDGKSAVKQGENYQLSDGTVVPFSISYKGTTYLPVRKVSELLSLGINYDNSSKTVQITTSSNASKTTDDTGKTNSSSTTGSAVNSDKTTTDKTKDNSSTNTTSTTNGSKEDLKVASTGYSVINECTKEANEAGTKVQHIIGFKDDTRIDAFTSEADMVKSWSAPKWSKTGFSNSIVYKLGFNAKGVIVSAEKVSVSVETATVEKADNRSSVTMDGKSYALSTDACTYRVTEDDEYRTYTGNMKQNDIVQLYDTDSSKDGYEVVIFSRP